jgi:hypothetical protein
LHYPIKHIVQLARDVESFLKRSQDIEWAWDQRGIHLIQARPITEEYEKHKLSTQRSSKIELKYESNVFPEQELIGLKGAAMSFFVKIGWFQKPIVFIKPFSVISNFKKKLQTINMGNKGITIRFSFKNEIGLPRFFVKDKLGALAVIKRHWKKEWFGIVHSFIDVQRSFELYVDSDYFMMEHVPGIWESDSTLKPDIIIGDPRKVEIFQFPNNRKAKRIKPDGQNIFESPPLSRELLIKWSHLLNDVADTIRYRIKKHLPVLCHFVGDKNDEWHFLNLRQSHHISKGIVRRGFFHPVRTSKDMKLWDGKKPILLQLSVERGNEELISTIIPSLPRKKGFVFIDAGVLSHPAIILREFGINPIPAYTSHKRISFNWKGIE